MTKADTTPIRDLGAWAESTFEIQCSDAGVTRNKSIQDRTGWDYLIEFPPKRVRGLPSDLQPTGHSARVQVKSKARGRAIATLKLSNALRFAKEPSPCFVVVYLATNGGRPVRVFAKHFWEPEIEHTLRRAREAGETDERALAAQKLVISFGPEDEHTDDLIPWMDQTAGSANERYAENKGTLVRTVGHGQGSIHGTLSIRTEDLPALIDHQLGLTPNAPISNIVIKQQRFGIDVTLPLPNAVPQVVNIRAHPTLCRVRIRGGDDSVIWLDGEFFVPVIPALPDNLFKFRVVADFLEIVAPLGATGTLRFTFTHDDLRSLSGMGTLASVLFEAGRGPLDVQIFRDDAALWGAEAHLDPGFDAEWLRNLVGIVDCLKRVADGIEPSDLRLSIDAIQNSWNDIVDFGALVTGGEFEGTITLAEPAKVEARAKSFLAYGHVEIGDWCFLAVVGRPILSIETEGVDIRFRCGAPRVKEAMIRRGKAAPWLPELRKLYARALTFQGAETLEMFGGDFHAMLKVLVG